MNSQKFKGAANGNGEKSHIGEILENIVKIRRHVAVN